MKYEIRDLCFEIIQKCSNECLFCSSNSCMSSDHIISIETFKKTIDFLSKHADIEELSISGGEPFMHPDIVEMIRFCKSKNIKTCIFTSGCIPNRFKNNIPSYMTEDCSPENMESLQKTINDYHFSCIEKEVLMELKEIGVDKLVFSIHTIDLDMSNILMGNGEQLIHASNSITLAKECGIYVDTHFVLNNLNFNDIEDVVEVCKYLEVDQLSILKFVPQGRGMENEDSLIPDVTKDELKAQLDYIKHLADFHGINLRIGVPLSDGISHKCTAGKGKIHIRYDGVVLPCASFKDLDKYAIDGVDFNLYNINDDLNNILKYCHKGYNSKPLCLSHIRR